MAALLAALVRTYFFLALPAEFISELIDYERRVA